MADMNDVVQLAVDAYKGKTAKYSVDTANKTVIEALIKLNNGSTKLDYKAIRDGKCPGLFAFIEQVLGRTVIDGLQENDFFNTLVEYRNIAEGDENHFIVEDNNLFFVEEVADGTQALRRQRLSGTTDIAIPTSMKAIRFYEELRRVLAKRVDFNKLISVASASFRQKILNDIYTLWTGATQAQFGGAAYFPAAGSYDEDALLDTIAHTEAAAGGETATIVATKKGLRKLKPSIESDGYKDDMYNFGYCGKFYGTPVVAIPQRHKIGTTNFVFEDNVINIVAGGDKPIKFVYEGDPTVFMGTPTSKADLTQEYLYGEAYGLGIVTAGGNSGIGRYQFTD